MKYLFGAVLILLMVSCREEHGESAGPPNIVVFLVDDMGWQDTSVPFHTEKTKFNLRYRTPNMERLAAEGMKFTQAYATPVCSPSRISLLTGMNAARHRVTNWTLRENTPTDRTDTLLQFPPWNVNGLSPEPGIRQSVHAMPLPQLLSDHGYHTIHAGKAHFGAINTPGADPVNLGFQVNIAGHAAGAPGSYYGQENFGNQGEASSVWAVPGMDEYHGQQIFLTEALTQKALKALGERPADKPFFLYLAHYAVHTPIQPDPRYFDYYLETGLDSTEAAYASMVEGLDKSLGDVMDFLENNGLSDNTIILFMSDNGGLSAHARGGIPNTHNRPLASGKGSLYEGGIREPMIVKWPGYTPPASETGQHVIIEDFFPTILEMAGITAYETEHDVDGQSFVKVLTGEAEPDTLRPLIWHFPNQWGGQGPGIGTGSAIRRGNWKLVHFYQSGISELYNLEKDIGERSDLANDYPDKVRELAGILTDSLKARNAQMPTFKVNGRQVPYPLAE